MWLRRLEKSSERPTSFALDDKGKILLDHLENADQIVMLANAEHPQFMRTVGWLNRWLEHSPRNEFALGICWHEDASSAVADTWMAGRFNQFDATIVEADQARALLAARILIEGLQCNPTQALLDEYKAAFTNVGLLHSGIGGSRGEKRFGKAVNQVVGECRGRPCLQLIILVRTHELLPAGHLAALGERVEHWLVPADPQTLMRAIEAPSMVEDGVQVLALMRSEKERPAFGRWAPERVRKAEFAEAGFNVAFELEDL